MSLITNQQFTDYADKITRNYNLVYDLFGTATTHPAGTLYQTADELLELSVGSDDYEIETDLNPAGKTYLDTFDGDSSSFVGVTQATGLISGLENHFSVRGSDVSATIQTTIDYLEYYNGADGSGTAVYDLQVSDSFAFVYQTTTKADLPRYGVYAESYHPYLDSTHSAGMGSRAVGGSFTAGTSIPDTASPALVLLEVTTNFSGGSAPPAITITGTDDADVADLTGATTEPNTDTTWSVTLDADNPAAAVSTTITPAVNAAERQTVAFASVSGIVAGSVLKVNAGLVDEEVIIVETVAGSNVTAAFSKAHLAGAAVTGFRTYATTPSVAGARCVTASNISITISGHSAGAVRVVNRQPRGAV